MVPTLGINPTRDDNEENVQMNKKSHPCAGSLLFGIIILGCSSINKEGIEQHRNYRVEEIYAVFEPIKLGQCYIEVKNRFELKEDPIMLFGIEWNDAVKINLDNKEVLVVFDGVANGRVLDNEMIKRMSISSPKTKVGGYYTGMKLEKLLKRLNSNAECEWDFDIISDRKAILCDNGCFFVLSTPRGKSVNKSDTVLSIGVKSISSQQAGKSKPLEGTVPISDIDKWLNVSNPE